VPCACLCAVRMALTTTYLDHDALVARLTAVAADCGGRASLVHVGVSVQGRALLAIRIGGAEAAPRARDGGPALPSRPAVKLVGNMHGDEVVGRLLLLNVAETLCAASADDEDPRVALVRAHVDMYILPSMNPDGFTARTVRARSCAERERER
jgi:murein tripeptide amidase MpaA